MFDYFQTIQRQALLTMALDYPMISFIVGCIEAWADGGTVMTFLAVNQYLNMFFTFHFIQYIIIKCLIFREQPLNSIKIYSLLPPTFIPLFSLFPCPCFSDSISLCPSLSLCMPTFKSLSLSLSLSLSACVCVPTFKYFIFFSPFFYI